MALLRRIGTAGKRFELPVKEQGKRSFFRLWKIRAKTDRWSVRPFPTEPKQWRTHWAGELPDPDGGKRRWASWEPYHYMWIIFWYVVWKYGYYQWKFINFDYWANEEVIWQMNETWCREVETEYLWVMYNRQKDGKATPYD